ncbi:MAG: hypothetical protein V3U15_00260 [Nitrospinota bacterium]
MKQLTLRGISPELEKIIKREAAKKRFSFNKTILTLLEEKVVGNKKKAFKNSLHHDLDALSGKWSRDEAKEFEKNLKKQRRIDKGLWK